MGLADRFVKKVGSSTIWSIFLKIQTGVATICAIIGVLGVCYNVITRYILHKNFFGMDDLLMIVMIFMYFFGGAFASYDNKQISADILTSFIKNTFKIKVLRAFQNLISTLVCGIYTIWLFEYVSYNFSAGSTTSVLKVPYWIPQSSLLIGFTFMTIYHSYNMIVSILEAVDVSREKKGEV